MYESGCKTNKISKGKVSEFYDRSMKSWLECYNIEIYSTNDDGKSVVVEWFIRTWRNRIYNYMTAASKIVQNDKLV